MEKRCNFIIYFEWISQLSVPPGDPVIDATIAESVIEGDFLSVRCISVGGSPQPLFTSVKNLKINCKIYNSRWILPNGTEANKSCYNTQFQDGATESILQYVITQIFRETATFAYCFPQRVNVFLVSQFSSLSDDFFRILKNRRIYKTN